MEYQSDTPYWPELPLMENWESLNGGRDCRQGNFFRWLDMSEACGSIWDTGQSTGWQSPDCKAEIFYSADLFESGWCVSFCVKNTETSERQYFDTFEDAENAIFNNPDLNSKPEYFWGDEYFLTKNRVRINYLHLCGDYMTPSERDEYSSLLAIEGLTPGELDEYYTR